MCYLNITPKQKSRLLKIGFPLLYFQSDFPPIVAYGHKKNLRIIIGGSFNL